VKFIADFAAESVVEMSAVEGEVLPVIFDGQKLSGWIEVLRGNRRGLVPLAYCSAVEEEGSAAAAGDVDVDEEEGDEDSELEQAKQRKSGVVKAPQLILDATRAFSMRKGGSTLRRGGRAQVGRPEPSVSLPTPTPTPTPSPLAAASSSPRAADAAPASSSPRTPAAVEAPTPTATTPPLSLSPSRGGGAVVGGPDPSLAQPYFQPESTTSEGDSPRTRKRKKRVHVLQEIVVTERDYVRDLRFICTQYLKPIRSFGILPEEDISAIFRNVDTLYELHKELYSSLERATGDRITHESQIAPVFLALAAYLKVYSLYCVGQEQTREHVLGLADRNPEFKKFVDEMRVHSEARGLDILAFLIKPVQRICKYPLLIREVCKATPDDHPDFEPLNKAQLAVTSVADHVNEQKRMAFSMSRMKELDKQLYDLPRKFKLAIPTRRFLMEGDLVRVGQGTRQVRRFFLFNDLLIYARHKGSKRFQFRGWLTFDRSTFVEEVPSDVEENAFQIIKADGTFNVLAALSSEDQVEWMKQLGAFVGGVRIINRKRFTGSDDEGSDSDADGGDGQLTDADRTDSFGAPQPLMLPLPGKREGDEGGDAYITGYGSDTGSDPGSARALGDLDVFGPQSTTTDADRKDELVNSFQGIPFELRQLLLRPGEELLLEAPIAIVDRSRRKWGYGAFFGGKGGVAVIVIGLAKRAEKLVYASHMYLSKRTRISDLRDTKNVSNAFEMITEGYGSTQTMKDVDETSSLRSYVLSFKTDGDQVVWKRTLELTAREMKNADK
jgi:hypothetical protein